MSTPCYVGRKACGCYVAVTVNDGKYSKETAKTISDWINRGYTVEHKDTEFARANIRSCQCKPVRVEQSLPLVDVPA